MPSQYARNRRALQVEILRRVEAGERLRAVSAAAGMPCAQTVRNWARGEGTFGKELARARRIGDWRRGYGFDEDRAAAFLARARAGESVHDLLREPGAPGRRLYDRWRAGQAAFAEATLRCGRGAMRRWASRGGRGGARSIRRWPTGSSWG